MIKPLKVSAVKARPHVLAIPHILDYKTLLYIGGNIRRLSLVDIFFHAGYKIDILEIFKRNCQELRKANKKNITFNQIILGDVRNVKNLIDKRYDVVCWWQGPEHIEKHEIIPTINKLEAMTKHIIFLGCPYGVYPQKAVYGNENEKHLSTLDDKFFNDLDYKTVVFKTKYRAKKKRQDYNLLAWKNVEDIKKDLILLENGDVVEM